MNDVQVQDLPGTVGTVGAGGPRGRGLFALRSFSAGDTVMRIARGRIFQEVFLSAGALARALEAAPSARDAQGLLEHTVPGLSGRFYRFRQDSLIFFENHADAPNCSGMTFDWLDGEDASVVLTKVALRAIAAGEEITVDYNGCSGYDTRTDRHMRVFLGFCRRYGVTKRPSVFRAMAATEAARRARPGTTDLRHREALFVVPRECILEAARAKDWRAVAALTRCNVLTTCKGAEHGWLGASFSCLDILICLHQRMSNLFDAVVLAKGHAARGAVCRAVQHGRNVSRDAAAVQERKGLPRGARRLAVRHGLAGTVPVHGGGNGVGGAGQAFWSGARGRRTAGRAKLRSAHVYQAPQHCQRDHCR